jgi:hypothetical protein
MQHDNIAIELACTRVVIDFARYADMGEYEKVADLFAQCGTFTRRGETFSGRKSIADSIDALLQNRRSAPIKPWWRVRHFCSNIIIDVVDREHARGSAYYTIYRYQGEQVDGVPPITGPALIGDYADKFVLTPAGWRFESREVHPAFFNPAA